MSVANIFFMVAIIFIAYLISQKQRHEMFITECLITKQLPNPKYKLVIKIKKSEYET